MKIFPRERLRQYLEMIKPLENSIIREICESHEVLRKQREEYKYSLNLAFSYLKSINNNFTPSIDAKDLQKKLEETIENDNKLDNGWHTF